MMNTRRVNQARLSRATFATLCAAILVVANSCATAGPITERDATLSDPRAQLIQRLEDVDYCSRMNANAYFASSANSELSIYFADKADEVEAVLHQLRSGHEVPAADIKSALDTSYAKRIGGYPC
jgi:hypothetical protein